MILIPLSLRRANEFILANHRHHGKAQGHKFSLAAQDKNGELIGVIVVGRPVARMLDDGVTAEVTRLCTDGTKNACSFLYAAAARVAKEMGYRRIVTYILGSETGHSLKATGWQEDEIVSSGGSWSRPSRARIAKHPLEPKKRFSKTLRK